MKPPTLADRRSQKAFYDLHSPEMFAICRKYTKCHQDAEDALQNGFIKVFLKIADYRGEGSFQGWMKRIFINESFDMYRQRTPFFDLDEKAIDYAATGLSNLHLADLNKQIDSLAAGYRVVFKLFNEGYTHREIGNLLNISESTSKSQYNRGRNSLLKKIKAQAQI